MSRLITLAMASSLLPLAVLGDYPVADMLASQLSFDATQAIAIMRINPVIRPGVDALTCGSNLLVGPNNIQSDSTSAQLRGGTCTSSAVGGTAYDMSAYSAPHMYHQSSDGHLTPLTPTGLFIQYNLYSSAPITPFPDDWSMSAGDQRNLDTQCGQTNHNNPGGYYFSDAGNSYNIPQKYTSQIGTVINFPDCWDGQPFDQSTQDQHLVHSITNAGWPCPSGFSIKLPQLSLVYAYSTGSQSELPTNPNGPTYVMSNGDPNGCSLHGSFVNGWQPGVLSKVLSQCNKLGAGNSAQCPALKISDASTALASSCKYSGQIPQEDVGITAPVTQLAGCLQAGTRVPKCKATVPWGAPNGFDTNIRGGAGLPYFSSNKPAAPKPSSTSTTAKPTSTTKTSTTAKPTSTSKTSTTAKATPTPTPATSGHNLFACTQTNWLGSCANIDYAWNTCVSLKPTINGVSYSHNIRSAGTDDAAQCTLYNSDTCDAKAENWVLAKGGAVSFAGESAHWGSFKCVQR